MKNQYVKDLILNKKVSDIFQIKEANYKTTGEGKGYIAGTVRDKTGNIPFVMWGERNKGVSSEEAAKWLPGALFNIQGLVSQFNNRLQVKVDAAIPVDSLIVEAEAFEDVSPVPFDELKAGFKKACDEISDKNLSDLIKAVFSDKEILERYYTWPAAASYHHAYKHGLFEHSLSMTRVAVEIAPLTGRVDKAFLIAGCLLHDIGKIYEFTGNPPYEKTDEGRMLGHIFMGAQLVKTKAKGIKDFPEEKLNQMLHMIISHHGQAEFGSPVIPATPEALALHHIDNMDAKLQAADLLIQRDQTPGNWTDFSKMLDTSLYKGGEKRSADRK